MARWKEILLEQSTPSPPRLDIDDAVELYDYADLSELMHVASIHRRLRVPGNRVTYLVDRNVNYTNVCTINCQFCSFYRSPGHPETYLQTIDQISQRFAELEEIGGSRVLMQGGVHPDLPLEWYTNLIKELRLRHPSIDLDCFSPIEIEGISEVCGLSTKQILEELHADSFMFHVKLFNHKEEGDGKPLGAITLAYPLDKDGVLTREVGF